MGELVAVEASEVELALPPPPAPALRGHALARLPGDSSADPYWRLVAAFLVGYPPHSSRAYFGDLKAWAAWCASPGVHPLAARRHHVDTWVRHLSQVDQPATGRPASPASIARRLSCLSKFYDYGIRDAEVLEHSPVAGRVDWLTGRNGERRLAEVAGAGSGSVGCVLVEAGRTQSFV
jgi:hypothetical protein